MVKKTYLFSFLFLLLILPFPFKIEKTTNLILNQIPKETYMVEMRDGIKLATDVYLPGNGKYPVVLIRTPYGREGFEDIAGFFTKNGYALVVQDIRGTGESEGIFRAFLDDGWNELQDGNDTVEWILKQDWCNGRVAIWGGSAMGIAGYMLVGCRNIDCALVAIAASNLYEHAMYLGGEFRIDAEEWLKDRKADYMIDVFLQHYNYDNFWKQLDLSTRYDFVETPIYHVGGWFDIFAEGIIDAFVGLQNKENQKLVMGPWTHEGMFSLKQGDFIFPPNSIFDASQETLKWFDYWMKGIEFNEPPVKFYMIGECSTENYMAKEEGNEWWYSNEWPPMANKRKLFLGDGTLGFEKIPNEGYNEYLYNPANPAPTIGGRNLVWEAGPKEQSELEARDDVLVYVTPPLNESIAVAGEIKLHLWISSSCKDTDFVAKLCDVYPDGKSYLISEGILMARHRKSFEREDFLEEGKIYEINVSLGNIAIMFNRGHRIKLFITSSNYPAYERNPNTGDAIRKNETYEIARNRIYFGGKYDSYIELPIIEKIEISPTKGIYFAGRKLLNADFLFIIGKINFEVMASCDKVIFYLNNEKKWEDDNQPFTWHFDEFAIGKQKMRVEIYKDKHMIGREIEFFAFNLS